MILFRCTLKKWAKDLSGTGAYLYGGRWNSVGVHMIYTAENNLLAALEVAIRIPLSEISKSYVMIPIAVPDGSGIEEPKLAKNWYTKTAITKNIGDTFIEKNTSLLMKVPSAIISDAYNFLINPQHPDIKKVKTLEPRQIVFDKRLVDLMQKEKLK